LRSTPTSEEELILLLCGTKERRRQAASRLTELSESVNYETLAALMSRQLLLPILGTRIVEAAPAAVPLSFTDLLQRTREAGGRRGIAIEALATQIQRDLSDAGIRALPLKGTALARNLYGDPGMRPARDIDILVESEELSHAAEVLARRGYELARGGHNARGRLHLGFEHDRAELPTVEIHWRIHWYEEAFSRCMLRRSEPASEGLRARPADELASLLLFFSRDGLTGLRLAVDVATWWDVNQVDEQQPPLLDQIASEAPELQSALLASTMTLSRLVGIRATSILSEQPASRRALAATRLANWTVTGDWDQINANLTLVDLLLSPRGGGRSFVERSLVPPSAQISSMYRLRPSATGRLAFWRIAHVPKLVGRYLIALWRVRCGRCWVALPASVRDA